jgi:uncharacterized membrane protein
MGAVIIMLAQACERKTDWYIGILGKIRGYRDFLKLTEKDRIEKLVGEDPDYFYKNLAYAYALDVTDAYAKQFRDIAIEPPSWYEYSDKRGPYSGNIYTCSMLNSTMKDLMHGVSSSMTSQPGSSGGSGGGSFSSGGGAGGGGGGSW